MKSWSAVVRGGVREEIPYGPLLPRRQEWALPDWMMLDGFLRLMPTSGMPRAFHDSSSTGHRIIVGLRAVEAPMASTLYLELCRKDIKSQPQFSDATAVAAHRNSILLRFVFLLGECLPILEEFFVYQASPMRLIKLPTCPHRFINSENNNMGILCKEDGGEFVAAHLIVRQKGTLLSDCPVSAELCCTLARNSSWRTINKCVPIRHAKSQRMDLLWWNTDTVISFGDFICWVDYLRGILFCDVSSPNPELQYVPLPVNPYKGVRNPVTDGRLEVFAYRSVCVAKDGIRFVDVAPWNIWFFGTTDYSFGPVAIRSWTLSSDRSSWELDGKIAMDELSILIKDLNLPFPCTQLEFPLVDMEQPHIIYCVMRESICDPQAFIVAVDLSKKTLGTPVRYALNSKYCGQPESFSDASCCNLDEHEPFLPCEFSKYVRGHIPISSRTKGVVDV